MEIAFIVVGLVSALTIWGAIEMLRLTAKEDKSYRDKKKRGL